MAEILLDYGSHDIEQSDAHNDTADYGENSPSSHRIIAFNTAHKVNEKTEKGQQKSKNAQCYKKTVADRMLFLKP